MFILWSLFLFLQNTEFYFRVSLGSTSGRSFLTNLSAMWFPDVPFHVASVFHFFSTILTMKETIGSSPRKLHHNMAASKKAWRALFDVPFEIARIIERFVATVAYFQGPVVFSFHFNSRRWVLLWFEIHRFFTRGISLQVILYFYFWIYCQSTHINLFHKSWSLFDNLFFVRAFCQSLYAQVFRQDQEVLRPARARCRETRERAQTNCLLLCARR